MKSIAPLGLITLGLLLITLGLIACGQEPKPDRQAEGQSHSAQTIEAEGAATTTGSGTAAVDATASTPPGTLTGEVVETMDSGGYTYVLLDTGDAQAWTAGPVTAVTVGTRVSTAGGMLMRDFTSSSLERTFAEIWFVPAFVNQEALAVKAGEPPALPEGHPSLSDELSELPLDQSVGVGSARVQVAKQDGVALAAAPGGGQTIAEIYAQKQSWAGQEVLVRGRVVKFTPKVMDRNWLHIQDGTGETENADLTVTTTAFVEVGDVVVVRGTLALDRDFGFGYHYALLVENAQVTVE